ATRPSTSRVAATIPPPALTSLACSGARTNPRSRCPRSTVSNAPSSRGRKEEGEADGPEEGEEAEDGADDGDGGSPSRDIARRATTTDSPDQAARSAASAGPYPSR